MRISEEQVKALAKLAAERNLDNLLDLESNMCLSEESDGVLLAGLTAAFIGGFVAGHMAGRAAAYVFVEAMASEFTGILEC